MIEVKATWAPPPHWIPSRLMAAKAVMAKAPQAGADTMGRSPSSRTTNSPSTTASPATDPGPLTHISIQILRKAQKGPKPSRMM